jgi:hypothetical protein
MDTVWLLCCGINSWCHKQPSAGTLAVWGPARCADIQGTQEQPACYSHSSSYSQQPQVLTLLYCCAMASGASSAITAERTAPRLCSMYC